MDFWIQHLGKEVAIARDEDGRLQFPKKFSRKTHAEGQILGKIVGTDACGSCWIMLDENFVANIFVYHHTLPPLQQISVEFRNEVQQELGRQRFVKLHFTHSKAIDIRSARNVQMNKTKTTNPVHSTKTTKNETFLDTMKADAEEATFRVASTKIVEGIRSMISLALMAKLEGNATAESVQAILNTPLGMAIVQGTAGYALTYLTPKKFAGDPRVKRLAKEFRVSGMATAGGVVLDEMVTRLTPVIESALEMLPGETVSNVRVLDEKNAKKYTQKIALANEDEQEHNESFQRMVVGSSLR